MNTIKTKKEHPNNNMMEKRGPVIILGGCVNALGIVRSLGQAGIPSIVMHFCEDIALHSKYVYERFICPHPAIETESFISFMVEVGKQLPRKAVLFCDNDISLITISRHQKELEPYYLYPMSSWHVIERCIDKAQLHKLAVKAGVPHPKTIIISNIRELQPYNNEIIYPCVLKPAITMGFAEKLGLPSRTLNIETADELDYWQSRMIDSGFENTPLILQELIPGGVESLYTLTAYSNKNGDILAYSTGHKIRQNPANLGTIISGRVTPTPELLLLGQKLIKAAGFYGISNTEFKKDPRDGVFKLIEINPRPGMWNYSVMASGINMPYIAYEEIHGNKMVSVRSSKRELVWILSIMDLYFSTYGYKKTGFPEYSMTFRKWLATIKGKKVDGVFMLNDPKPGLIYIYRTLKSAFRISL